MKKIVTFISIFLLFFACSNVSAQCVINYSNFTPGFSPATLPCIMQNASYGQAVQIYVPSSFSTVTVDSVSITGITGLPAGISDSINPPSGTIYGGGWGCIWFSGNTSAAVGNYPLSFSGTAYTSYGNFPLSSALVSGIFSFSLSVCATPVTICDTLFNLVSPYDTPEVYVFESGESGYWSGNNSYGDIAKAEQFTTPVAGANVNGAFLSFGVVTINPADSDSLVTVYVWDGNSIDGNGGHGAPGTALDSATIPLGAIAEEVTSSYAHLTPLYIFVSFNSSPAITDSVFYVGVKLPVNSGDTVALFTSSVYGGQDGRGWEDIVTNTGTAWNSYATDFGHDFGNYIAAAVCATGNVPVAAFSASPQGICTGDTVQFTDLSTNSPTAWLWTLNGANPSLAITQNPSATYSATGTYSVKLVTSNYFGADSITQNNYITVNPIPNDTVINSTPATSATTANGSITIAGTSGAPAYTYMWSNDSTGATLSHVLPGYYNVTITDGNGCMYVQDSVLVTFINGINQFNGNTQIKIYPNPASEQLNIEWSSMPDAEISIIDMNGKTLKEFIANGSLLNTFDVHDLSSGTYVIRITDHVTNQKQSVIFNKL